MAQSDQPGQPEIEDMSKTTDPVQERQFYRILDPYLDLERNTGRKYTAAEYNLDGMPRLAALFANPEGKVRVMHVAGTKGKGSTCHYATAFLVAAGYSVGTFVSPHLLTFRERFLINGEMPSYAELLEHTGRVEEKIRQSGLRPTFFEVLTILALSFFVEKGCQFVVLETGIGGRLDCTNYVPRPECTAITAVSFDHTALLGDTIGKIASEKAGIIKAGVPVVCGRQPFAEAETVIRRIARERGAPVLVPGDGADFVHARQLAAFQRENLAVAAAMCRRCGVPVDPASFRPPPVPGRFQCLRESPLVVIDAAHNADSAKRLVEALKLRYPQAEFLCVLGVVAGKDTAGIVRELSALTRRFVFTHPRVAFKGSDLSTLEGLAAEMGLRWQSIPHIDRPEQLPGDTALLFTGSFFTASIGAELFAPGE